VLRNKAQGKMVCWSAILAFGCCVPSYPQAKGGEEKSEASKPTTPKPADSSSSKQGSLETHVEQYLRNLYAWGPSYEVKVGPPKSSPVADLLEVPVKVSLGGQSDTASVYVTKNGTFMFRGELSEVSADPFADVRSKLHVGNSPSMGPEGAKITLVEFADFECPSCRQLDLVLRDMLPKNPDLRLVFKHYPLTEIHPWAMTAAIASQCVFEQNPAAFWKFHDTVFDQQDVISASNAWDKMIDLGNQLGVNEETYRTCMAAPETKAAVNQAIEEGHTLNITATPTTFVNARRVVGPDKPLLNQYVKYELSLR
jgi:protein-disulfide isomerase